VVKYLKYKLINLDLALHLHLHFIVTDLVICDFSFWDSFKNNK